MNTGRVSDRVASYVLSHEVLGVNMKLEIGKWYMDFGGTLQRVIDTSIEYPGAFKTDLQETYWPNGIHVSSKRKQLHLSHEVRFRWWSKLIYKLPRFYKIKLAHKLFWLGVYDPIRGKLNKQGQLAYDQVQSRGHMVSTDLAQFIDAGYPVRAYASDAKGIPLTEVNEIVDRGRFSIDMLRQALEYHFQ